MISASNHNDLLALAQRKRPILGPKPRPAERRHAWSVRVEVGEHRWFASVWPGFINGVDPLVPQAEALKSPRAEVPPREPVANLLIPGLLDFPLLPLKDWRDVTDGIPQYFADRGVRPAPKPPSAAAVLAGDDGSAFLSEMLAYSTDMKRRPLKACDLVLTVPRLATTYSTEVVDPSGVTGIITETTVAYSSAYVDSTGSRSRLTALREYKPPEPPSPLDRLLGVVEEEPADRLHLATIYALGPAGLEATPAIPTQDWEPSVAHFVFYNLSHAPRVAPLRQPPPPIRNLFPPSFGAGLLNPIANKILATGNEAFDKLWTAANNQASEGMFWTA